MAGRLTGWRRGACAALLASLVLAAPAAAQRVLTFTESSGGLDEIPLGYPVPTPVDSLTPVDGFRTYASLFARHQQLTMESDRVRGFRVGTSIEGREIWAYALGDEDALTPYSGTAEPAAMLIGGVHAREWQPPEVVTGLFERIAAEADRDGLVSFLGDHLNLILVPMVNPDGFLQTQRYPNQTTSADGFFGPRDGRMRRKNMRGVDGDLTSFGDRLNGVDLNRNYPTFFQQGSSGNPQSLVYRGVSPRSEPEVQAVFTAADLAPAERLRLFFDVHSFSQVLLSADTPSGRRNALAADLARRMRAVDGNRYGYRPSPVGSGLGASSIHFGWAYEIPSYTVEVEPRNSSSQYGGNGWPGDGFILPESEIDRVRRSLADTFLLGLYHQAGPPAVQAVEVHDLDSGEAIYRASWGVAGGDGRRGLTVTGDQTLVPGRLYRLWVAFDRPMRWRRDGRVVQYPGQSLPLAPDLRLAGTDAAGQPVELDLAARRDHWIELPGGAPDGYLRYRDDAVAVDFVVPRTATVGAGFDLRLEIDAQGLSGHRLDADPTSPVDWADGGWSDYQDSTGASGDAGGIDRTLRLPVGPAPAPGPCVEDDRTHCLLDGRFRVRVRWRDHRNGPGGYGQTVPFSDQSGLFWFFDEENVELIVKALDARGNGGGFWFFYGALSDVEYAISVTDTSTGRFKVYRNPGGELCGMGDTRAFPGDSLLAGDALGDLPTGSLRPLEVPGDGALSSRAAGSTCQPDAFTHCLLEDRFEVKVDWHVPRTGQRGQGRRLDLTDQTGLFWFFNEENLELAVKVLDGRPVTGKFWVFYGALSDVEYTVTVTDTMTGAVETYFNPSGNLCGNADTGAF